LKVLLDENLDHALRKLLGRHEVVTVAYMGWAGLKNGELLAVAERAGIEVLLTGDKTLRYEQNLSKRRLAVVVLAAIELPIIQNHLPGIIAAIDDAVPGSFREVDCGTLSRKKDDP
jgi:PIN like domain